MRKGFEGLYGLVRDRLLCEPLSGHLLLFCNGQRNRLKVLARPSFLGARRKRLSFILRGLNSGLLNFPLIFSARRRP
jgi:IS66 Orf2 like protein